MRFGAHLYTVREFMQGHKDFAGTIKKIASIGYDCIQAGGIPSDIIPASEIAETCRAYNLDIISANVNPLKLVQDTAEIIEDYKIMNCKYVNIATLPSGYIPTKLGFRKFITDFIPAARALKEAGLQLTYSNRHFEFEKFDGKVALQYMFENFDDLHFSLDTYWMQTGGADPAQWIEKMANRVDIIQLKDYSVVGGKRRTAEVMDGNLNWRTIFEATTTAGVKYGMIEQDDCYGKNPFECLRASLNNLKNGYQDLKINSKDE